MSRLGEFKKTIFRKFSKNLELLFENFQSVEINIPKGGGYVCPLGMTMHSIEGLNDKFDDQLTLEHVPPKSLGGKGLCLVRKDINSSAGHSIDKFLLDKVKFERFLLGKESYNCTLQFNQPKLSKINSIIKINKENKFTISFEPGRKNFKLFEREIVNNNLWDGLNFKLKLKTPKNQLIFQSSLLKIAYLKAFSEVGYSLIFGPNFLLNPHYEVIREQILKPKQNIIEKVPIIKNLGPKINGVGIVTNPHELISIFVTFPVGKKSMDYYTVFLPAPDYRGFASYDYFKSLNKEEDKLHFEFSEIRKIEFWRNKEDALLFHQVWKDLTTN